MPSYKKFETLLERDQIRAADVAKATGILASVFSDWKSGKSYPKVDKLYKLAKHFNVTIEYFLEDEEA